MKQKVIYCQWGLANSYHDRIEINKNLKNNKNLRDVIIKHELKHSNSFDLMSEFDVNIWKILPSLSSFIIKNPSTWIDFIPIQLRKDRFIFDFNLIMLYGLAFFSSAILYKIIF